MARIFQLMSDWEGSGKLRGLIPGAALVQLGHEVMCSGNPGTKGPDGTTFAATADVWIGHRTDSADGSALVQGLARMPRTAMLVIDIDDNVWHVHPSNPAYSLGFPHRLGKNCSVVDLVTVCSHGLAEFVEFNSTPKRLAVVPNCLPEAVTELERDPAGDLVKLIWGGSSSHIIDVPILRRVLPRIERTFDVRLLGAPFNLGIDPSMVEHVPWSDNIVGYWRMIDGDIGLAPLADEVFNLGKSDLKVLEYMARGIPFVASRVGPFAEISHLHGKAGFFVSSDDEWVEAIQALIDDETLRKRLGEHGKEWMRSCRLDRHGAEERERLFGIAQRRGERGVYAESVG